MQGSVIRTAAVQPQNIRKVVATPGSLSNPAGVMPVEFGSIQYRYYMPVNVSIWSKRMIYIACYAVKVFISNTFL
jgi:hypothetical protein